MQLTHFTDIGLRLLMYVAQAPEGQLVTLAEVATQFGMSQNHLVKVVNRLVKVGWVEAVRGRNGGVRLMVPPERLHLGKVVRELEGSESLLDCHKLECVLEGSCQLQGVLRQATTQLYNWLDQYTLADVIKRPTGPLLRRMYKAWPSR